MKISVCIEPLFEDLAFADRIAAAKDCGADAIEFWDASSKDLKAVVAACTRTDIPVAAISVHDSWKVRLNDAPTKVLASIEESIRIGRDLGCTRFIALAGEQTGRVQAQKALLIENLKRVVELAEKHGAIVLVEPLNSLYDHKGYYLVSAAEGFEIIRCVDSPGVKLLYDVYHMQLMEGNLLNSITGHMDAIGHFHFAGVSGRHEPHTGEICYPALVKAIDDAGYTGYCGLEYWPTGDSYASLQTSIARLKARTDESC